MGRSARKRSGGALVALALLAGGAACGPWRAADGGSPPGVTRPVLPGCGEPVTALAGASSLTVTATFAASAARGGVATGTVRLTSTSPLRGVAASEADVFVARDGVIVALPLPKDLLGVAVVLDPGSSHELPARAGLAACDGGGRPLVPGDYELYAVVTVGADGGPGLVGVGGPWPLTVR